MKKRNNRVHFLTHVLLRLRITHAFLFKKRIYDLRHQASSSFQLSTNQILLHACKTPLSILLCNLESALADAHEDSQKKKLKRSLLALKYLNQLLGTTTDLPTPYFSLLSSLKRIKFMYKAAFESELVDNIKDCKDCYIEGNSLLFEEAVHCLLKNAYESYKQTDQQKPVIFLIFETDSTVQIIIQDCGEGMNPFAQDLSLIPGISYKEHGTGLGLSFSAKTIQEQFDGDFVIDSKLQAGTTITITLPIYQSKYTQNPAPFELNQSMV